MPGTVIVGTQWGDEGKGRFTDYLAQESDLVVRYQGGHNAGHRIVVGSEVGVGTVFTLRFPAAAVQPAALAGMAPTTHIEYTQETTE